MAEKIEVVGFVGGELMSNTDGTGAREVVLALPLGRLLVRMVRIPAEREEDVAGYLTPLLQELSPYPDEPLTVGWETVSDEGRGRVVLAAALPESSADDLAELLDAKKLRVTRLDALVLGELRALWPQLGGEGGLGTARRLVLIESAPELEMIVLDGDMPSAIRSIPAGADLRRETMLALLEAEDFGGAKPLAEIVTVSSGDAESSGAGETRAALAAFGPVRAIQPVSAQESLDAIAARSEDAGVLDARPASWREYLEETRFKRKLAKGVAAAVGVWVLAMGVLFGVPMVYGYMTDYQKDLSKRHQRQYTTVRDTKAKVELVRKYSDHDRGALEMMKAVSDRLPEDVELDAFDFKRAEGLVFSGVADETRSVYALKDRLTEMADEDGNRIFGLVRLGRLSAAKGKQRFTLECRHEGEEEDE